MKTASAIKTIANTAFEAYTKRGLMLKRHSRHLREWPSRTENWDSSRHRSGAPFDYHSLLPWNSLRTYQSSNAGHADWRWLYDAELFFRAIGPVGKREF